MREKPHSVDLTLDQIVPCLKRELPQILVNKPVMLAYLFGSVVDQTTSPFSDVDIALVFDPHYDASAYQRMQVEFAIAEAIEKRCIIPEADVRSINRAPLMVQGQVLTNGILLCSRDEIFRVEYEVAVRKRYFDFFPVNEMMQKAFFRTILQEGLSHGKS